MLAMLLIDKDTVVDWWSLVILPHSISRPPSHIWTSFWSHSSVGELQGMVTNHASKEGGAATVNPCRFELLSSKLVSYPSMSMRKKVNLKVNLEVNLEVNLKVNLKSKLTFSPFFAPPLLCDINIML